MGGIRRRRLPQIRYQKCSSSPHGTYRHPIQLIDSCGESADSPTYSGMVVVRGQVPQVGRVLGLQVLQNSRAMVRAKKFGVFVDISDDLAIAAKVVPTDEPRLAVLTDFVEVVPA